MEGKEVLLSEMQPNELKKPKKTNKIIWIILVIILLLGIGGFIYYKFIYLAPKEPNKIIQISEREIETLVSFSTSDRTIVTNISDESITIIVNNEVRKYNSDGELLTRDIYDEIASGDDDLITIYGEELKFYEVVKDSKKGLINQFGELVVPTEYDNIIYNEEKMFILEKNGLFGVVNPSGEIIIPIENKLYSTTGMDDVIFTLNFKNGYAAIIKNNKIGVVNEKGETIIPYIYDVSFTSRLDEDGFYYLNGDDGYSEIFSSIKSGNKVYFQIRKGNKYGVINEKNEVIIPFVYEAINYSDKFKYFFAYTSKKMLTYNTSGILLKDWQELIFAKASDYFIYPKNEAEIYADNDKLCLIYEDLTYKCFNKDTRIFANKTYIDKTEKGNVIYKYNGDKLLKETYDYIDYLFWDCEEDHHSLVTACNIDDDEKQECKLFNENGNLILTDTYLNINLLSNELLYAEKENHTYEIYQIGSGSVNKLFTYNGLEDDEYYFTQLNNEYIMIEKEEDNFKELVDFSGNIILEPIYDQIECIEDYAILAQKNGNIYLFDLNGVEIKAIETINTNNGYYIGTYNNKLYFKFVNGIYTI